MQCNNGEYNETELTGKQKAAWIGALCVIGFLVLGWLLVPSYQAQQKKIKTDEAARIAQVAKSQKTKTEIAAIIAARFGPEKPMAQIEQGTTDTADVTTGYPQCSIIGQASTWVLTGPGGTVDSFDPGDWVITSGGSITVPSDATIGNYTVSYDTGTPCTDEFENEGFIYNGFEFEVIAGGDPGGIRPRRSHIAG